MLKGTVKVPMLVAAAIAALSCTEGPTTVDAIDSAAFAKVVKSTTTVTVIPGGATVAGASATLKRTGDGVAVRLNTNGLTAGNAYTLWAFSGGPPALFVTGNVVGGSGRATFAGRVISSDPITRLFLRDHGPKLPGNVQFSGPSGGCPPNTCVTLQRADF